MAPIPGCLGLWSSAECAIKLIIIVKISESMKCNINMMGVLIGVWPDP